MKNYEKYVFSAKNVHALAEFILISFMLTDFPTNDKKIWKRKKKKFVL